MADPSARRRAQVESRTTDMIRAVALILVPIVAVGWLMTRKLNDYPVQSIEWRPQLAEARRQAPYPVLVPTGLPTEGEGAWVPTTARWSKLGAPGMNDEPAPRNQWQFGMLRTSGEQIYFALNQGDLAAPKMVAEVSREGTVQGDSLIKDVTWKRLVSPDGRTRSLVWTRPEVTTMVTADTDFPALEAFAATLTAS